VRGGRAKDLPGVKYSAICGKFDVARLARRASGRSKFGLGLIRSRADHRFRKFRYN